MDAGRLLAAVGLAGGVTVTSMADGHGSRTWVVGPEDAQDDVDTVTEAVEFMATQGYAF